MANDVVREKTAQCRLSEEEYSEVKRKADALGLSVGSYLRVLCLGGEICVYLKPNESK